MFVTNPYMERVAFVFCAGTVLGKWERAGQMGQNLWHNAQLDQVEVTPTGLLLKDKKEHFGGMLIAPGLEPLFMVL
jgi:hypothetical protein